MILDALEDAGLTLADVDGVCHAESAVGLAEYLGIHPTFTESTMTGGSSYEVHLEHAAAAIAAGLCDVVVSVYAATPRGDRSHGRRDAAPHAARARTRWPSGRCPTACACPWAPTRSPPPATCTSSAPRPSSWPRSPSARGQWAARNPRARYREPTHRRRRARLAPAGQPAAPPRLLPGHRRRRRLRHDERGPGALAAQATGLRAGRRHLHRSHGHRPDARPHHDAGRRLGRQRLRHGRPHPGRGRRADGLRQLHHHRAAPPRGPGLLSRRERAGPSPPRGRSARAAARWP